MDVGFLLRAQRILTREPAESIDFAVLVASLASHQAETATARAARDAVGSPRTAPDEALAELLSGGPRWREARRTQGGSFHRGFYGNGRKEP